jgi:hypothetical protein
LRIDDLGRRTLWHPEADDERTRGSSGVGQKIAAGQARLVDVIGVHRKALPHVGILEAASRIAWRTRW